MLNDWLDAIRTWEEHDLAVVDIAFRLFLAMVLGSMVGLERERHGQRAGMRTHAVVSVGSALIMLVSTYGFPLGTNGLDPSRIAAQVVSGIGFLGAGVIIFRQHLVRGLTTAASIWAVCGVGLAAGGDLPITATLGAAFLLLVQGGMRPLKSRLTGAQPKAHGLSLVSTRPGTIVPALRTLAAGTPGFGVSAIDITTHLGASRERVTAIVTLHSEDDDEAVLARLQEIPHLDTVEWRHAQPPKVIAGQRDETDDDED